MIDAGRDTDQAIHDPPQLAWSPAEFERHIAKIQSDGTRQQATAAHLAAATSSYRPLKTRQQSINFIAAVQPFMIINRSKYIQ